MSDRLKFRRPFKCSVCGHIMFAESAPSECGNRAVRDTCDHDSRDYDPLGDWEQCTGLKDSNGKLIYEGDICRSPHFKTPSGRQHYLYHIVRWSDKCACWFMQNRGSDTLKWEAGTIPFFSYNRSVESFEILGNIHENPELLS